MKYYRLHFDLLSLVFLMIPKLEATIHYQNDTYAKCPLMDTDADVIIGGMFPVHVEVAMENCLKKTLCGYKVRAATDGNSKCIRINKSGISWSEAMINTIQNINNNNRILPGVKLGYIICDSYNSIARALDISLMLQSLRHVTTTWNNTEMNTCSCQANATRTISSMIGGASSKISSSINYIMNVDDIPQISYSSTSPSLSDKFNFRTFFRTIPPDTYQGKALIDIIHHFNWSYISTVASSDDYGRLGVEALKAANDRICFAVNGLFDTVLSLQSTKNQITKIVSQLKADTKSKVVILFCEWPGAQAILQEAEKQNLTGKTWIASEAWGNNNFVFGIRKEVIGGMIGIVPSSGNIEKFKTHVKSINPRTYTTNTWFNEYLDNTVQCLKDKNESYTNITLDYAFNKCANVMDAVYALAYALHGVLQCPNYGEGTNCLWRKDNYYINPNDILSHLQNVTFTEALGVPMSFDAHGDPIGSYDITNLKPSKYNKNTMEFNFIGKWNGNTRELHLNNNTNIIWNGWTTDITRSVCSEPCKPGYFGIAGKNKCCWKCFRCQIDSVKSSYGQDKCEKCPKGYVSNVNHTRCIQLLERYLRWSDAEVISLLVVSFTCASLVLVTLFVFVWFRETPIVKASNRELSYLLLVTLFVIFLGPLVFIGLPTEVTCVLRPAGTGLLMTIATSILSVRAYRYMCIFKAKMHQKTRKLQGLTSQFFSIFACTLPPLATIPIWYSFYRPKPSKRVVIENAKDHNSLPKLYRECNLASQYLSITLSTYVVLISIICCTLAFRTRKLPEVFSDAKWLAMTMFANNTIWFACLALYLVRRDNRPLIMASNIVASAFVIWIFNFLPKIIVILMHPEKNKRLVVNQQIFSMTRRRVDKTISNHARARAIQRYIASSPVDIQQTKHSIIKRSGDKNSNSVLTDMSTSDGAKNSDVVIINHNSSS